MDHDVHQAKAALEARKEISMRLSGYKHENAQLKIRVAELEAENSLLAAVVDRVDDHLAEIIDDEDTALSKVALAKEVLSHIKHTKMRLLRVWGKFTAGSHQEQCPD